jgi:hypothetical protein
VCTGTTGTLITKPISRSRKAQVSRLIPQTEAAANGEFGSCPSWESARMLNVWTGLFAARMAVTASAWAAASAAGLTTCEATSWASESIRTSLVK